MEDEHLPDGNSFDFILGSPVMLLLAIFHILFKPTLAEAPRHLRLHASVTPLQSSVGDLLFDGNFVFVSLRDLDVIYSFVTGLDVKVLL